MLIYCVSLLYNVFRVVTAHHHYLSLSLSSSSVTPTLPSLPLCLLFLPSSDVISICCWSASPVVVVANLHQSIDDPHPSLALNALAALPIHLHLAREVSFKHGCTPVRVWLEQRAADESLGSKFLILKAFIHVYLLINPNTKQVWTTLCTPSCFCSRGAKNHCIHLILVSFHLSL